MDCAVAFQEACVKAGENKETCSNEAIEQCIRNPHPKTPPDLWFEETHCWRKNVIPFRHKEPLGYHIWHR